MKLPIGIQTFEEIINEDYVYVDKTEHIHRVVTSGKYFFLSRPRRFGKSLLLSTMKAMYLGQKELFKGLWIADHWDWEQRYPVLHFRFSSIGFHTLGLAKAISSMLKEAAAELGIELTKEVYDQQFRELIEKASQFGKVVILIDEYDKPIIDFLEDLEQAKENRKVLKNFYSVLKDSDPYIKLLFITGVSRFAKTSIFSDLNNVTNLMLHPLASTLLGITQQELDQLFSSLITKLAVEQKIERGDLISRIKEWYNGYSWDGKQRVYNPFSLLSFFLSGKFSNFWFGTGTPTFLVKLMRKNKQYRIENLTVPNSALDSYDLEHLNPTAILFQTGYLTIKEELSFDIYKLDYPNYEVKVSLEEHLLNAFTYDTYQTGKIKALQIAEAFKAGDIDGVIQIINATFATIPNQLWQKENEAFYHALIHLTFSLVGVFIQSEINSATGRLDAKVETGTAIYVLEFKLDQSADAALQQIRDRNYFQAYIDSSKEKVGIGINFSTDLKTVEDYKVQGF